MSDAWERSHQIMPRVNDGTPEFINSLVDAPSVTLSFASLEGRWFKVAIYAALLVLFLWPAIYNRQPFFSPDTSAYIRGFDAGVVWLTGKKSAWTTWASALSATQGTLHDSSVEHQRSFQNRSFIIAGRSVSYGALLYLGELLGGLWASVAVQAGLALAAVSLTLKHFGLLNLPNLLMTAGALGLVSSLPFFASFALPDIFAGLSILAAANFFALGERLTRWERVFWFSILAAAVVFHPSHLAILLALLGTAIIGRLLSTKVSLLGIMALSLAAVIGFASEIGFTFVVEKILNVQVTRPPVIMGRMIADGTGAAYLRDKCSEGGFTVCKFVDRLRSNSDEFLWDTNGVYTPARISERKALGQEQYRFAAAVLAHDPVGEIAATLSDGIQQLNMFGLSDFIVGPEQALPRLPSAHVRQMMASRLWEGSFPIEFFSKLTVLVAIFSLIFVGVALSARWRAVPAAQKLFCLVILFSLLLNALVCGGLSGPHERYQARLTWLIPLIALLLYYRIRETAAVTRRSPSIVPAIDQHQGLDSARAGSTTMAH